MEGITHGMPFDEYLKIPALSASRLKHLMRSPLNYKWHLDHPDNSSSPSQVLGTAAHTAILEPHRMKTDYVLWDGGTRRGKAWEAFQEANATKSILTVDEYESVKAMHTAVRGFGPAATYLAEGNAEVTLQWEMHGRRFKGRVDWLTAIDGQTILVDLKTTRNSSAHKFGSDAFKLGYYLQFALYAEGWKTIFGESPRFVVLAVENQAPFEPAVFDVDEDVLGRGSDELERLLCLLDECERANHWPPASETEQRLTLPAWAYTNEDDDITDLGLTA